MRITRLDSEPHTVALLMTVERESLGDSNYTLSEAQSVLRDPSTFTLGAWEDDVLLGFLFCLCTAGRQGPRLELDMLGVLPRARCRGIATALVERALDEGRRLGAVTARAVVAEDNEGSRRAFERNDFARRHPCRMMVHDLPPDSPQAVLYTATERNVKLCGSVTMSASVLHVGSDQVEMVQVNTLSYAGFWVERLPATEDAARATADYAAQFPLDEVGHLLPVDSSTHRALLVSQGWQDCGRYDVLERSL